MGLLVVGQKRFVDNNDKGLTKKKENKKERARRLGESRRQIKGN
jgi:hypothetical protein